MLVGRNGCGKSTLLQLIHSGSLQSLPGWPENVNTHLVAQEAFLDASEQTPLEMMLSADPTQTALRLEVARLEESLGELEDASELNACVAQIQNIYDMLPEDDVTRASRILAGLGMTNDMMNSGLSSLSGGWRARVALAVGMFIGPDLLLLDEPTNHLDLDAVDWLASFLSDEYKGTLLCVSHDRSFVNDVATDVIMIDQKKLEYFNGNLDLFEKKSNAQRQHLKRELDALEVRRQRAQASLNALQLKVEKREDTIVANAKQNTYTRGGLTGGSRERTGNQNTFARRKEKIERRDGLDKTLAGGRHKACANGFGLDGSNNAVSRVGRDGDEGSLLPDSRSEEPFTFPASSPFDTEEPVIELSDVCFRHTDSDSNLIHSVDMGVRERCRIGIIGSNGCGKSTFLQLIAGKLKPTSGELKHQRGLNIAYVGQHDVDIMRGMGDTPLEYFKRIFPVLKDHEIVEKLAEFGIADESTQSISSLSGGQRMRVLLAQIAAEQPHFMILDEPTNHLDIYTIDSLISALSAFAGGIIFATHNRHFLDEVADEILDVSQDRFELEKTELEPDVIHVFRPRSVWRDG